MTGFAVLVEFRLKPGTAATFRTLVDANAETSVTTEVACRRFDVVEPDDRPDTVLLYEIYTDRDAFDLHLASDHYRRFTDATQALCDSKTVTAGRLVFEGGA